MTNPTTPDTPEAEARPGTLFMIGNAHIDHVWLWDWREGFAEIKATFRSALDLMREYPDFVFTHASAAHYAWIEENEPEMFEEIKARVQEGRWDVVGGWWVEPDCNLPCGESFVRQGLYGQRFFKTRFGRMARVGYNPDSFGHAASLPQILRGHGLESYVFMRPGPHEKGLPGRLFRWASADGSAVLAFRIPFEYLTWGKDVEGHVRKCASELRAPFTQLMCFFGVGNHGGGPTRENLESIKHLSTLPDLPRLALSTPTRFFEALEGQDLPYPTVQDELQHHASGCYAAHSGIKAWNRRAERLLVAAESLSSVAARVAGLPYPATEFERAWKRVLVNQFHDILAGTSLEAAYDDAQGELGEAASIASRALNAAVQRLSWRVNVPQEHGVRPIVVFNPHAWASSANVELEFGGLKDGDVLLDDEDQPVPLQTVQSGATVTGWRKRLSFNAALPPLGYRLYRVVTPPAPAGPPPLRAGGDVSEASGEVSAGEHWLENARYRLELDPETGCIARLFDKTAQVEVFNAPAARGAVIRDESDTWSHGVLIFDDEIGSFGHARVKLLEHGPVKATLRARSFFGDSSLIQDFTLYRNLERVDVNVTVDWRERGRMLKLRFPVNLHFPRATFGLPYGVLERPLNGEEEPAEGWADLSGVVRSSGAIHGLSLLCDAKSSFSARERPNWNAELSMTVLRSPVYAHHDPRVLEEHGEFRYMDQGEHRFRYALLPHAGGWEAAGTVRHALELALPPIALIETGHDGPLPQVASHLEVSPPNVIVTAVKRAEDDDSDEGDLIVRALETTRAATRARLRVLERSFEADFRPSELKTFRVPRDPNRPVLETNLLEEVVSAP